MSSSFLLPLRLNPPPQIFHGFQKNSPSKLNLSTSSYYSSTSSPPFEIFSHNNNKKKKLYTFSCVSSSNQSSSFSSSWEREEERWMREEQRWLREEKRWLREESRWNSERQSLLQEIATLKFRIQTLERQNSRDMISSDTVSNISSSLLHVEMNRISEIGSGPGPILFHSDESEEEEVKEIRVFEKSSGEEKEKKKKTKKIPALRKGAEGEDVRAMQDALQKLGFYSGEEDMEFSSFSSGTERAIKTWQATLGVREDGIMTEELLERLFVAMPGEDHANGATIASMTETSEFQQTVKESSFTEVEASHNRVFLLGENRWEEPSRLTGRNKLVGSSKMEVATTKCLVCRGEGRVLCLECDGTGEPNVEPQFLEWVDEGAKCPYCEGLGYNICDVCEGKTTTIPVS